MKPRHLSLLALSAAALFSLAACGNPKEANEKNFRKAIQAHLDSLGGLCVNSGFQSTENPEPFIVKTNNFIDTRQGPDALAAAGLVKATATEADEQSFFGNTTRKVPATRYEITDKGKKFLREQPSWSGGKAAAFCTGRLEVASIKNFTEPGEVMGMRMSRVNFLMKVSGEDAWARHPEVLRTNKELARLLSDREIPAEATMILTNEGWVHEKQFKQ